MPAAVAEGHSLAKRAPDRRLVAVGGGSGVGMADLFAEVSLNRCQTAPPAAFVAAAVAAAVA